MLSLANELNEEQMGVIYNAPDGFEYAVQNKEIAGRSWNTILYCLPKREAKQSFKNCVEHSYIGYEYRAVRLSRYPPCSVVEVISYFRSE